jgi:hypothetical protein
MTISLKVFLLIIKRKIFNLQQFYDWICHYFKTYVHFGGIGWGGGGSWRYQGNQIVCLTLLTPIRMLQI